MTIYTRTRRLCGAPCPNGPAISRLGGIQPTIPSHPCAIVRPAPEFPHLSPMTRLALPRVGEEKMQLLHGPDLLPPVTRRVTVASREALPYGASGGSTE